MQTEWNGINDTVELPSERGYDIPGTWHKARPTDELIHILEVAMAKHVLKRISRRD